MFGTIRRHQSWLWIIIAGVTIVSFVVYFGPNGNKLINVVGRGGSSALGELAGQPITPEQYAAAKREVYLNYFLEHNQWPNRSPESKANFNEEHDIYVRLFMIQQQKALGIDISTEAVVARAKQMLGPLPASKLIDEILKPEGLDYDDFERDIRHNMGIQQLLMTVGMSGTFVTPQEAEALYRNENKDVAASAVIFSASNYLASASGTPAELSQFYTNQLANYRIPVRIAVDYVKYDITNYLAAAKAALTNVDQIIDQKYSKYVTNAESRASFRQELIRSQALQDAMKVANGFAAELYDKPPGTNRLDNFSALAQQHKLAVRSAAPFDMEEGPHDLEVQPNFASSAFKLTADEPFSGPIPAEDGVYVLALKRTIPSEIPALSTIEAKVSKDFRNAKAAQLAQQAAIKFDATVTNALAQGKSFAAICTEARLKPESLPQFSLSTQAPPTNLDSRLDFRLVKQVAFGTQPGQLSRPAPTRDGAFLLFVDKLLPVDEAKMKKEMPRFLAMMRQARQGDAANQWFQKQINLDPVFGKKLQDTYENAQMRSGGGARPRT